MKKPFLYILINFFRNDSYFNILFFENFVDVYNIFYSYSSLLLPLTLLRCTPFSPLPPNFNTNNNISKRVKLI